MLKPWAHKFAELLSCILDMEHALSARDPGSEIDEGYCGYMMHILNPGKRFCEEIGADSGGQMDRLLGRIDIRTWTTVPNFPRPRAGGIARDLTTLRESLDRELRTRSFLFVPTAKAGLYEQVDLFGAQVSNKFGKTTTDIKDAGTCLALSMPTAAVFHLMCVLEVGLDSLASALGLPYRQANWETLLRDIEEEIKKIGPQQPKWPNWKEDKEFFSGAALEFRFFRDAWRNHVTHARAKYNEGEALHISEHTKAFIQHLSQRLRERPSL